MKKICFAWQVTLAIYSPRTPSYFFHHIKIWKHKYHNIFHEQFIIHLLSEDLFERSRHHKERKGILYDIILEKHFRSLFGGIWVQGHNILDQFSCDIKENILLCELNRTWRAFFRTRFCSKKTVMLLFLFTFIHIINKQFFALTDI